MYRISGEAFIDDLHGDPQSGFVFSLATVLAWAVVGSSISIDTLWATRLDVNTFHSTDTLSNQSLRPIVSDASSWLAGLHFCMANGRSFQLSTLQLQRRVD